MVSRISQKLASSSGGETERPGSPGAAKVCLFHEIYQAFTDD